MESFFFKILKHGFRVPSRKRKENSESEFCEREIGKEKDEKEKERKSERKCERERKQGGETYVGTHFAAEVVRQQNYNG